MAEMYKPDPEFVKKCYEEGKIELDGIVYTKNRTPNKQALKLVGYVQRMGNEDSVIGDDNWEKIQETLFNIFSIDGVLLSRKLDFFEDNPARYFPFMLTAMQVVTFPFQPGSLTS